MFRPLLASVIVVTAMVPTSASCEANKTSEDRPAGPCFAHDGCLLPLSGPVLGAAGKILYSTDDGFGVLEPSTQARYELQGTPRGASTLTPAASPHGGFISYSVYRPGEDGFGGVDLCVMTLAGSNSRLVLAHDARGSSFSEPVWSADGDSLYYTHRTARGAEQVERVRLDGSDRELIVSAGRSPTLSHDGRWLVYVHTGPEGFEDALWLAAAHGRNAMPLFAHHGFVTLAAPRFAPDGKRLASPVWRPSNLRHDSRSLVHL